MCCASIFLPRMLRSTGQKLSRKAKTRQVELAMAIAEEDETFPRWNAPFRVRWVERRTARLQLACLEQLLEDDAGCGVLVPAVQHRDRLVQHRSFDLPVQQRRTSDVHQRDPESGPRPISSGTSPSFPDRRLASSSRSLTARRSV